MHTAATVVLRAIDLHEEDEGVVKTSTESDLTLKHMPRHLIVESDIPLQTQCEGLPENHFPMNRGTTYWDPSNDPANSYKIKSEGFPMTPYFSLTTDSITGKTVDKAKLDTGNWRDAVIFDTAMRLYTGLSRVNTANDILLTGLLGPAIFTNGPCP